MSDFLSVSPVLCFLLNFSSLCRQSTVITLKQFHSRAADEQAGARWQPYPLADAEPGAEQQQPHGAQPPAEVVVSFAPGSGGGDE